MRFETTRRSPVRVRLASCKACSRKKEYPRPGACIARVDQHRAPLQQVAVALQCQIDDRIEQRMARADERGERLPGRCHIRLLEGDPLVARQHRLAKSDAAVSRPHRRRHVRDLISARLARPGRAAQPTERLVEERLDVVRLQTSRFRPLHVLADAAHAARVHRVMGELLLFQQILQLVPVEGVVDRRVQSRADLPAARIRIASNGGHHGLARTIEVPRPDAAAAPPSGGAPAAPLPPRTLERQAARHRLDLPLGDHRAAAVAHICLTIPRPDSCPSPCQKVYGTRPRPARPDPRLSPQAVKIKALSRQSHRPDYLKNAFHDCLCR